MGASLGSGPRFGPAAGRQPTWAAQRIAQDYDRPFEAWIGKIVRAIAERTLGWLGRWRRLAREYEELPEVSETMVKLAMIRLMLHRLAHPSRKRLPAL